MHEKPNDNVRRMFHEFDTGRIKVNTVSGEIVEIEGLVKGQSVQVKKRNGTIELGWKVSGFDIIGDIEEVIITRGEGPHAFEEHIPLKELLEINQRG